MSDPKKHHFLPQFYLRKFAAVSPKGKYPHIWALRKTLNPNPISVAIKDTACITDYHTIEKGTTDRDRKSFERALSRLEDTQSKFLDRIIKTKRISAKDRVDLANLLTIMRLRVPGFKRYIQESLRLSVLCTGDILQRNGRFPEPPEALKPYLVRPMSEVFDVEIMNWALLRFMFDAAIHSRMSETFLKMNFGIIEAGENDEFVTSDTPIAVYHPDPMTENGSRKTLLDPATEFWMPLTPKLGLICKWNSGADYLEVSDDYIQELNRREIISAFEYIYSSKSSNKGVLQIPQLYSLFSGYEVRKIDAGKGFLIESFFRPVSRPN